MKKLTFAAIVAFAAVCAQAASVNWGYSSSGEAEKGNTIYLVVGDTVPTAISDWATWSADQTIVSEGTLAYNKLKKNSSVSVESTSDAITKDKSYFFIMLDAEGKNFRTSGAISGSSIVYDTANQESQITQNLADSFGAWTEIKANMPDTPSGDVPEPTSGLLLLVGAAGLALRRRRA